MTKNEALKQALEAIQSDLGTYNIPPTSKMLEAITAIKQALEQPVQEPVAWADMGTRDVDNDVGLSWTPGYFHTQPLYTTPPAQRPWVGLTDEETETLIHRFGGDPWTLLDEVTARLEKRNTMDKDGYHGHDTNAWRKDASEYERGFIDGMQKQMQSSVDKAVNAMSQRQWAGLTDEEIQTIVNKVASDYQTSDTFARAIEQALKEKNT
jgi:hypothetical protein